jgi:hypothetical protein
MESASRWLRRHGYTRFTSLSTETVFDSVRAILHEYIKDLQDRIHTCNGEFNPEHCKVCCRSIGDTKPEGVCIEINSDILPDTSIEWINATFKYLDRIEISVVRRVDGPSTSSI